MISGTGEKRAEDPSAYAAILIAGPTASGKSALAMNLADRLGGTVVNADAMQIYAGLRVLTARPSPADEARVPHELFGAVDPSERFSAGAYAQLAQARRIALVHDGRVPIFVGGTGLYFRVLTEGLAPVPAIAEWARAEAEAVFTREGGEGMWRALIARDRETAEKLSPSDPQRLKRAWAVLAATGRGLASWQREAAPPVLTPPILKYALWPDRAELARRIDERATRMVEAGAIDEVAQLREQRLDPTLPAMKAIGVPELSAYLDGTLRLDQAKERMATQTRRYAKRQFTWVRTQMADWQRVVPGEVPL